MQRHGAGKMVVSLGDLGVTRGSAVRAGEELVMASPLTLTLAESLPQVTAGWMVLRPLGDQ